MSRGMCLGIEIGGTKLQMAIGRGDGKIVAATRKAIVPSAGALGILEQIRHEFHQLVWSGHLKSERDLAAIGIGFGGPVDEDRGIVLKSHQIEGWTDFALADWMRQEFGVEAVSLGNDADRAGLGEALFGAGWGRDPMLYMNSGSGIGGALIIQGEVYRGSGLGAMEIGHLRFGDQTLEDIASGWGIAFKTLERFRPGSILANLVDNQQDQVTTEAIGIAASLGDPDCLAILRRATDAVGDALAHAVTLLAPRRVVLGGGVSLLEEDLWLQPIRRRLDQQVFPPFRGRFDVVTASLGEEVVLHGALAAAKSLAIQTAANADDSESGI